MEVGVRAFKNGLSRYLRRVRAGQRIVVTQRGRPVAIVAGIAARDGEAAAAEALVRGGLASWSGGKPRGCSDPPAPRGAIAAAAVLEDRR
jgi:prevent-host-death family protein